MGNWVERDALCCECARAGVWENRNEFCVCRIAWTLATSGWRDPVTASVLYVGLLVDRKKTWSKMCEVTGRKEKSLMMWSED